MRKSPPPLWQAREHQKPWRIMGERHNESTLCIGRVVSQFEF
jgi:hypothetical protein